MIYKFRNRTNPDDDVLFDAPTKAEAHKKLRTMVRASDYEEVVQKKEKGK